MNSISLKHAVCGVTLASAMVASADPTVDADFFPISNELNPAKAIINDLGQVGIYNGGVEIWDQFGLRPVSAISNARPNAGVSGLNNDDEDTPIWFVGPSTLAFPASWNQSTGGAHGYGTEFGSGIYASTGRQGFKAYTIIELTGQQNPSQLEKADVSENGNAVAIFDTDNGTALGFGSGGSTTFSSFASFIDDLKANTNGGFFANTNDGLYKVSNSGTTRLGDSLEILHYYSSYPQGGLEASNGMVAGCDSATGLINVYSSYGRSVRQLTSDQASFTLSHNGYVSTFLPNPAFDPSSPYAGYSYSQASNIVSGLGAGGVSYATAVNDIGGYAFESTSTATPTATLYMGLSGIGGTVSVFAVGEQLNGSTVTGFTVSKDRWFNRRNEAVVSYDLADGSHHVGIVRRNSAILYGANVASLQAFGANQQVTISGFNFKPGGTVTGRRLTVQPTSVTSTSITFTVPQDALSIPKQTSIDFTYQNPGANCYSNTITVHVNSLPPTPAG